MLDIGETGAILFSMRQHEVDFVAAFDTREGSRDGTSIGWWYINTLALSWSHERFEEYTSKQFITVSPIYFILSKIYT